MSEKEADRVSVLEQVRSGHLTQAAAAAQLALSTRQLRRLQRRYADQGAAGLAHRLRGQDSNRRLPPELLEHAQALLRAHYADFGPTLAAEKLQERHAVMLSVETVRRLMTQAGLWRPKRRRLRAIHPLRERRAARGELIQIDGSPHDWFEGRAPRCTLLVFVDDATGELMALKFVAQETTLDYLGVLHDYILEHGLPACLYSDRHSIFVTSNAKREDVEPTQFAKVLERLGIEAIQASSPQAKGRVERANQTLQDRLVKELRLAGINDAATANAWLPQFRARYNQKFMVSPRSGQDGHVPYLDAAQDLARACSVRHRRKLSPTLSCQFQTLSLQIIAPEQQRRLAGQHVQVLQQPDGTVLVLHQGHCLPYQTMPRAIKPALDSKTLNANVDQALLKRRARSVKPSASHPWKRWQDFEPGAIARSMP